MKKGTIILLICLTLITVLTGYVKYMVFPKLTTQFQQASHTPSPTPKETEKGFLYTVDDLFSKMTPEQRVAQMIAVPLTADHPDLDAPLSSKSAATLKWIEKKGPGVVTLFGNGVASQSAISAKIDIMLSSVGSESAKNLSIAILPLIAVDHEGGSVQRLRGKGFTPLPSWRQLCSLSAQERKNLLATSARELKENGEVNILFGPVVDVGTQSAALRDRTCSDDPKVVEQRASEWIEAFNQFGIRSVIKHYPGLGTNQKDTHRSFDVISLNTIEQTLFKTLLSKYPTLSVMSSHVGVKEFNPDVPCSLQKDCLKDITLGDEQLWFSDALEMKAATYSPEGKNLELSEVSTLAIEAGNSVLVYGPTTSVESLDTVLKALTKKYNESAEFRSQVDAQVKKILKIKRPLHQIQE
jgi:beta-N-acetylhexosaminidase